MKVIETYRTHLIAHNLAKSTQKTYLSEFKAYCNYFAGKDIRYISRDQIIEYLARLYDAGYSPSKVNQAINAIKFYKEKVRREKRQTYYLPRPKFENFIPTILTPEKMRDVCLNTVNLKHRCMLFMFYDSGIRRSELINLHVIDVHSKAKKPYLVIRKAKGNKSRLAMISPECVELIREYYRQYKPKKYLFEGESQNEQYSPTSIKRVLDKACKREGITQNVRIHDLRHNFATHCLEEGTSMKHIQEQLGHSSYRTTDEYYSHLQAENRKIIRPHQPKKPPLRLVV